MNPNDFHTNYADEFGGVTPKPHHEEKPEWPDVIGSGSVAPNPVRLNPAPGESLSRYFAQAFGIAIVEGKTVIFEGNGVEVTVRPSIPK